MTLDKQRGIRKLNFSNKINIYKPMSKIDIEPEWYNDDKRFYVYNKALLMHDHHLGIHASISTIGRAR